MPDPKKKTAAQLIAARKKRNAKKKIITASNSASGYNQLLTRTGTGMFANQAYLQKKKPKI
tara:strand:+ start:87 stop:269 length:183 start_codon:yes stop_codon:yes gene_type:complete